MKKAMIYTHVLNRGGRGVLSPVDRQLNSVPCEKSAYTAKLQYLSDYLGSLTHVRLHLVKSVIAKLCWD